MGKFNNFHIRWAFDVESWKPTISELIHAIACVQAEEKLRLGKFVFRDDFNSSLIGRLLLRKFVSDVTDIPYNKIQFARDDRGKPFLIDKPHNIEMDFNVSHQGRFAVLAGCITSGNYLEAYLSSSSVNKNNENSLEWQKIYCENTTATKIGVDIMKLEYTGGSKSLGEFFRLMDRNFSGNEWSQIKNQPTDTLQLKAFMRHWCLKEAYVKNIGVGITIDLRKISFTIDTEYPTNCISASSSKHNNIADTTKEIIQSTMLTVDGIKMNDKGWSFEEQLLDDEHCVAVAIHGPLPDGYKAMPFKILNFTELMDNSVQVLPNDLDYCEMVLEKTYKNLNSQR